MNKNPDTNCRETQTSGFLKPSSYSNPLYPLIKHFKYNEAENLSEFLCINNLELQSLGEVLLFM